MDLTGHELSHAYTAHTSGLIYQGESGALDESFSDIFGTGIENYALGTNNWTIAEDIYISSDYLRSLSNPKAKGDPNTYLGQYWRDTTLGSADFGGVHHNCGVQNYWFYLLSQGGSGTNDNGNSYNVTGIGIDSALAVAYRNNTVYLTSISNYNDAMQGSVAAAYDLFGDASPKYQSVKAAWCAVGLNCNSVGINEPNNELNISIYPNPASNQVTILSDGKPMLVMFYDLMGKEIISRQFSGISNNLDVSRIAKGMYVLKILEGENEYQQKIVIQ